MTSLNGQTIGFIGLGLMGKPMARNLKAIVCPLSEVIVVSLSFSFPEIF